MARSGVAVFRSLFFWGPIGGLSLFRKPCGGVDPLVSEGSPRLLVARVPWRALAGLAVVAALRGRVDGKAKHAEDDGAKRLAEVEEDAEQKRTDLRKLDANDINDEVLKEEASATDEALDGILATRPSGAVAPDGCEELAPTLPQVRSEDVGINFLPRKPHRNQW